MFLVPYYLERTQSHSEFKLTTLWLFLMKNGTTIWETDEKKPTRDFVINEYFIPNGLYGKVKCIKDNTLYFEVDITKTKVQNFYNWIDEEVNSESLEVWRPFFYVSDDDYTKQSWGWKEMTETISLGSFGSMERIWETVLE